MVRLTPAISSRGLLVLLGDAGTGESVV